MARQYKDLIVDEADGKARYNFINENGTVALHDIKIELASNVIQKGDSFGALAANLLLRIDDEGIPYINIDGGTY